MIKKITPFSVKAFYHKIYWISKNFKKIRKFSKLLSSAITDPLTYETDGLATVANADFIKESRFAKAYNHAAATNPWPGFTLHWRVYIVCWFADLVKKLDGDFVECGVNTGAYSRAIIDYVNFAELNKTFHLFDTYDGLVPELVSEKEKKAGVADYFSSYENVFEQVKATFAPFNVKIIRGIVPDTLVQYSGSDKIAYLSIDMNCVAPEIAAAEYFWDKLVSGGVMILDDYGFPQHIHQKIAFDEFAIEKGVSILSLPTSQGIVFKP